MTHLRAGDPGSYDVQAYFEGDLLEWCFEADDTEGYAIVYDGDGEPDFFADEVPTKRLEGKVEFRPGSFDK